MKNTFNLLSLLSLTLFSCESKPKPQVHIRENTTMHNYRLDDDEIARRKVQDSIQKVKDTMAVK